MSVSLSASIGGSWKKKSNANLQNIAVAQQTITAGCMYFYREHVHPAFIHTPIYQAVEAGIPSGG